jgi:hypothetical protein
MLVLSCIMITNIVSYAKVASPIKSRIFLRFWYADDMHKNFRCSGFLSPLWEWKQRQTPATEVGEIFFVEKRRERLHDGIAGGPGTWWAHGLGWGWGFYSLFEYCLRVEMCLRCRQKFPGKEQSLLDHLSPFGSSCSLSFNHPSQWSP